MIKNVDAQTNKKKHTNFYTIVVNIVNKLKKKQKESKNPGVTADVEEICHLGGQNYLAIFVRLAKIVLPRPFTTIFAR